MILSLGLEVSLSIEIGLKDTNIAEHISTAPENHQQNDWRPIPSAASRSATDASTLWSKRKSTRIQENDADRETMLFVGYQKAVCELRLRSTERKHVKRKLQRHHS